MQLKVYSWTRALSCQSVRLHNVSGKPYGFERGDKITQLVVTPVYYPEVVQVDAVQGGERGVDGYGSTGR